MTVQAASDESEDWPAPHRAWFVVIALTLIYALSFANRFAPAIFVEPIKSDLLLSDTQLSLLIGFAFVVFYATMGLPLARIGDRANRRNMLALAVPVWSGAMIWSGFADNFTHFFLARIVLGFGEATIGPLSLSIIADYFPPEKRSRPVSVWFIGSSAGIAVAYMAGGLGGFLQTAIDFEPLASFAAWRLTFIALGLAGGVALVLMLAIQEPERRESAVDNTSDEGSLAETVSYIRRRYKTFAAFFGASILANVFFNGISVWFPTLFVRIHDWPIAQAGYVLGGCIFVVGVIGPFIVSWLNDYYSRRGRSDASMYAAFRLLLIALPFAAIGPLMPNAVLVALLIFPMAAGAMGAAILPSVAVLEIVPNRLRAQVTAILFFLQNMFGYGVGPTIYAVTTEFVFQDEAKLDYSMALLGFLLIAAAVAMLYFGLPRYRRDIAAVKNVAAD